MFSVFLHFTSLLKEVKCYFLGHHPESLQKSAKVFESLKLKLIPAKAHNLCVYAQWSNFKPQPDDSNCACENGLLSPCKVSAVDMLTWTRNAEDKHSQPHSE